MLHKMSFRFEYNYHMYIDPIDVVDLGIKANFYEPDFEWVHQLQSD